VRKPAAVLFVLALIISSGVLAQTPHVALFSDPQFTDPHITYTAPSLVSIYAVAVSYAPITAVRYRATVPDCWDGAMYVGEINQFPVFLGDSQSGISIAFGMCLQGTIFLQRIDVFTSDPPPANACCLIEPMPDPTAPSGEIEFVDCSSNRLFGVGSPAMIGDGNVPPTVTLLTPPDSATSQPLDAQLGWESWSCSFYPRTHDVYFGTIPNPPLVSSDYSPTTFDPGPLSPSTTYYWKIVVWHLGPGGSVVSPVWNFTTESGVPVSKSSWGAIKALFR
jgi:hypothetical protein